MQPQIKEYEWIVKKKWDENSMKELRRRHKRYLKSTREKPYREQNIV
jgi:hypothetical protein